MTKVLTLCQSEWASQKRGFLFCFIFFPELYLEHPESFTKFHLFFAKVCYLNKIVQTAHFPIIFGSYISNGLF
jgi:hypothetical protein